MVFKKSYIWIVVGLVLAGVLIFLTHPLWCSHDYEVVRETEASCTRPGEVLSECRLCGKDKTETIEALGHSMRYETTEMEEIGESLYTRAIYMCDRCGHRTADEPEYYGPIPTTNRTDG